MRRKEVKHIPYTDRALPGEKEGKRFFFLFEPASVARCNPDPLKTQNGGGKRRKRGATHAHIAFPAAKWTHPNAVV